MTDLDDLITEQTDDQHQRQDTTRRGHGATPEEFGQDLPARFERNLERQLRTRTGPMARELPTADALLAEGHGVSPASGVPMLTGNETCHYCGAPTIFPPGCEFAEPIGTTYGGTRATGRETVRVPVSGLSAYGLAHRDDPGIPHRTLVRQDGRLVSVPSTPTVRITRPVGLLTEARPRGCGCNGCTAPRHKRGQVPEACGQLVCQRQRKADNKAAQRERDFERHRATVRLLLGSDPDAADARLYADLCRLETGKPAKRRVTEVRNESPQIRDK